MQTPAGNRLSDLQPFEIEFSLIMRFWERLIVLNRNYHVIWVNDRRIIGNSDSNNSIEYCIFELLSLFGSIHIRFIPLVFLSPSNSLLFGRCIGSCLINSNLNVNTILSALIV